jgi:uncharacterized protein YjbJ (UPF0337 family)
MEKENIKGAIDQAKGAAKDAAGKAIGDKKLQAEGKLDKAKGTVEKAVGNAKGVLRDLRDN